MSLENYLVIRPAVAENPFIVALSVLSNSSVEQRSVAPDKVILNTGLQCESINFPAHD